MTPLERPVHCMKGGFDYIIERSARRTTAIHIDPRKGVVVRAPKRATGREIDAFVSEKGRWINRKLAEMRLREAEIPRRTYTEGDVFHYLGNPFSLRVYESGKNAVNVIGSELLVGLTDGNSADKVRTLIRNWYTARAREIFAVRASFYAGMLGVAPRRISVRNQAKRWGSCSAKGSLNLNLRLAMMPPPILDYVVVHELCHLIHPNHGRAFWKMLERAVPDFAGRRLWLKRNGHRFVL